MFAKCIVSCLMQGRCSRLPVIEKSRIETRDKGKMGLQRPPWVGDDIAEDPGASKDPNDPVVGSWG